MINFIPFFKRKDITDGVEEPQEVAHFNSFGEGYDYYLSHYRTSMGWYHTRDQAKFSVASDEITEIMPESGRPFDMIRVKGLKDKINLFEVIILETSIKEYNKNSPLFFNVINFMESKNFHFYDLCDLKRLGNENSILVQFDSVFVKKNSKLLNFDFS